MQSVIQLCLNKSRLTSRLMSVLFYSLLYFVLDTQVSKSEPFLSCLFPLQIATAVKFLQNQKVRQSPLATRKYFLVKKGERIARECLILSFLAKGHLNLYQQLAFQKNTEIALI